MASRERLRASIPTAWPTRRMCADPGPAPVPNPRVQRCSRRRSPSIGYAPLILNSGIPVVAAVFPIATVAAGDSSQVAHELDVLDVLGLLVAELALHPQPQRRSVRHIERFAVHVIGDERLRMVGIG